MEKLNPRITLIIILAILLALIAFLLLVTSPWVFNPTDTITYPHPRYPNKKTALDKLEERARAIEQEIKRLMEEARIFAEEAAKRLEEARILRDELNKLKEDLDKIKKDMDDAKKRLFEATTDADRLKAYNELESKYNESVAKMIEIEGKYNELESKLNEAQRLATEANVRLQAVDALQLELKNVHSQVEIEIQKELKNNKKPDIKALFEKLQKFNDIDSQVKSHVADKEVVRANCTNTHNDAETMKRESFKTLTDARVKAADCLTNLNDARARMRALGFDIDIFNKAKSGIDDARKRLNEEMRQEYDRNNLEEKRLQDKLRKIDDIIKKRPIISEQINNNFFDYTKDLLDKLNELKDEKFRSDNDIDNRIKDLNDLEREIKKYFRNPGEAGNNIDRNLFGDDFNRLRYKLKQLLNERSGLDDANDKNKISDLDSKIRKTINRLGNSVVNDSLNEIKKFRNDLSELRNRKTPDIDNTDTLRRINNELEQIAIKTRDTSGDFDPSKIVPQAIDTISNARKANKVADIDFSDRIERIKQKINSLNDLIRDISGNGLLNQINNDDLKILYNQKARFDSELELIKAKKQAYIDSLKTFNEISSETTNRLLKTITNSTEILLNTKYNELINSFSEMLSERLNFEHKMMSAEISKILNDELLNDESRLKIKETLDNILKASKNLKYYSTYDTYDTIKNLKSNINEDLDVTKMKEKLYSLLGEAKTNVLKQIINAENIKLQTLTRYYKALNDTYNFFKNDVLKNDSSLKINTDDTRKIRNLKNEANKIIEDLAKSKFDSYHPEKILQAQIENLQAKILRDEKLLIADAEERKLSNIDKLNTNLEKISGKPSLITSETVKDFNETLQRSLEEANKDRSRVEQRIEENNKKLNSLKEELNTRIKNRADADASSGKLTRISEIENLILLEKLNNNMGRGYVDITSDKVLMDRVLSINNSELLKPGKIDYGNTIFSDTTENLKNLNEIRKLDLVARNLENEIKKAKSKNFLDSISDNVKNTVKNTPSTPSTPNADVKIAHLEAFKASIINARNQKIRELFDKNVKDNNISNLEKINNKTKLDIQSLDSSKFPIDSGDIGVGILDQGSSPVKPHISTDPIVNPEEFSKHLDLISNPPEIANLTNTVLQDAADANSLSKIQEKLIGLKEGMITLSVSGDIRINYYSNIVSQGLSSLSKTVGDKVGSCFSKFLNESRLRYLSTCIDKHIKVSDKILSNFKKIQPDDLEYIKKKIDDNNLIDNDTKNRLKQYLDDNQKFIPKKLKDFGSITFITYEDDIIDHNEGNPSTPTKTIKNEPVAFVIRVKDGQEMIIRPDRVLATKESTKLNLEESLNSFLTNTSGSPETQYSIMDTRTKRGGAVLSTIDIELAKKSKTSEQVSLEFKEWRDNKNNYGKSNSEFPDYRDYISGVINEQNSDVIKNSESMSSIWEKAIEDLPDKYLFTPYKYKIEDSAAPGGFRYRISPDPFTYIRVGLNAYNNAFEKAYSYKLFNKGIYITDSRWGSSLLAQRISPLNEPYVGVIHHTAGMYLMTSLDIALLTIQTIESVTKTYPRTKKQYGAAVARTGLAIQITVNTIQTVLFWFIEMQFLTTALGVFMGPVATFMILDQMCQIASTVMTTFYEEEENHDIKNVIPDNLQAKDQENIVSALSEWVFSNHYITNSDFENINRVIGIKGQIVDAYGYAGSTGNLPSNLSGSSGPKIDPNGYYYYPWDRLSPLQMLEIVNNKNDNYNYVYTKSAKKAIVDFVIWNSLKTEDELRYITYDEYNMYLDSFERGCHKFIFDGENFQYVDIKPNLSGSPNIWTYDNLKYDCENSEKYFYLSPALTSFYNAFKVLCNNSTPLLNFVELTKEPEIISFDNDNNLVVTCYSPNIFISLCTSIVNSNGYDFSKLLLYERNISELIVDFLNYNYLSVSSTLLYTISFKLININSKLIKTSYYFKIKTAHASLIESYDYTLYGVGTKTNSGPSGSVDPGTLFPVTITIIDALNKHYNTLQECVLNIHNSYVYTPQLLLAKAYLYYGLNGYSLNTDLANAFITTFKNRMKTISQIFTNNPLDKDKYIYGSDSYCRYIESKEGSTTFEIPLFPMFYDNNEHNIRYVEISDPNNNLGIPVGPADTYKTGSIKKQLVFYRRVKETEWITNLSYFLTSYSYYIRHPDDNSPEIMDLSKIHQGSSKKGNNPVTNEGKTGQTAGTNDSVTQDFSINYNGIEKGKKYLINAQRGFFYYMRTSIENKTDLLTNMYTLCFLNDVRLIYNLTQKLNWNMDILSNHIAMGQLLIDNAGNEPVFPTTINSSSGAVTYLNTNDPVPVVVNDSQDTIYDYYIFNTNKVINGKEVIINTKERNAFIFGPRWLERIVKFIGSYNAKEGTTDLKESSKKYIIGFSVYNDTTHNTYDVTFYTRIDEDSSDDMSLFVTNKSTRQYVFSYYRVSNLDYTLLKTMLGKIYSLTVFNCQWTAFVIANIYDPSSGLPIAQNVKVGPMSQLTLHYIIKDQFIPNDDAIIFQFRYVGEFIALKKTRVTDITYKQLINNGNLNRYMVAYYGGAQRLITTSADNVLRAVLCETKEKFNGNITLYTVGILWNQSLFY